MSYVLTSLIPYTVNNSVELHFIFIRFLLHWEKMLFYLILFQFCNFSIPIHLASSSLSHDNYRGVKANMLPQRDVKPAKH